jgi:hypothetical protein
MVGMKSPFIEHFIQPLLWCFRIVLVIFTLAFIYTVIILWFPDSKWNLFQPTVSGNIAVLASLLVALGTLGLAYAAFETIHSSRQREKRDRKSVYFDEVIKWAEEIYRCGLKPTSKGPDITEEDATVGEDVTPGSFYARAADWELREIEKLESEHRLLLSRRKYLEVMCNRLGSRFGEALDKTTKALADHAELLGKCIHEYGDTTAFDGSTLNRRKRNIRAVGDHNPTLNDCAIKLIELVTSSKADLIVS